MGMVDIGNINCHEELFTVTKDKNNILNHNRFRGKPREVTQKNLNKHLHK
jgi:hypothetical protein